MMIFGDAVAHPVISVVKPDWDYDTDIEADRDAATCVRLLDMLARDEISVVDHQLPSPAEPAPEKADCEI